MSLHFAELQPFLLVLVWHLPGVGSGETGVSRPFLGHPVPCPCSQQTPGRCPHESPAKRPLGPGAGAWRMLTFFYLLDCCVFSLWAGTISAGMKHEHSETSTEVCVGGPASRPPPAPPRGVFLKKSRALIQPWRDLSTVSACPELRGLGCGGPLSASRALLFKASRLCYHGGPCRGAGRAMTRRGEAQRDQ